MFFSPTARSGQKSVGILTVCIFAALPAAASEFMVRTTTPFKPAMEEIVRQFETRNGDKVSVQYGVAPAIEAALKNGESCDLVIAPPQQVSSLAKAGLVVDAAPYAQAYLAVGVKAGSPAPDVSTEIAFRDAMTSARRIAYSAGLSGNVFAQKVEQAGLTPILKDRANVVSNGPVGASLVRGEADFGVQQNVELTAVPGVKIVGPLPGVLASTFPNSIATCKSASPEAGRLLAFIRSDSADRVLEQNGWKPASR